MTMQAPLSPNAKTIDIQSGSKGNLTATTGKPKPSSRAVTDAHHTEKLRSGSNVRRTLGLTAGHTRRGYRPDLRKVCRKPNGSLPSCGSHHPIRNLSRTHDSQRRWNSAGRSLDHMRAEREQVCKNISLQTNRSNSAGWGIMSLSDCVPPRPLRAMTFVPTL